MVAAAASVRMYQKEWGSRMRKCSLGLLHLLFHLKEGNTRQAHAALGACDALDVRVQFSWADHQALPSGGMFIEK